MSRQVQAASSSGLLRERERERATGGFGQESVITAAEDTSHDRPESLSCSRPEKNESPPAESEVLTAAEGG